MGNQLKALGLLYVRPVKATSQILDQGRLSVALVLAFAAGLLFALPAILQTSEASLSPDGLAPDELEPVIRHLSVGAIFSPIVFSLIVLAVVFVPVAVVVVNKLEGTGSTSVVLPRDYMPMLVCHVMAYAGVLLPTAVIAWIPELPQIAVGIAALLYFAFLSVCAIRTVAGTGWGRAAATAASAFVVSAGSLYLYSFARNILYYVASPWILYYLYITFGSEVRSFGGGLSSRQRMRQLLEFAAVNPHDADAPYQLGLIYQQRRDYTRARECFERAIAIDPKEPEAQYQLGRVLRATGDPSAALEHLKTAAAIDNKLAQSEVLREIGAACLDLGRNEEARDILREYTNRRSFDPEGLYLFGEALSRVGDVAAAREALQQAIEAARTAPRQRRRQIGQWGGKASKLLRQLSQESLPQRERTTLQGGMLGKGRQLLKNSPAQPSLTESTMRGLLKNSGFRAFLWTQFLGALNDNLYKTIVSLRAVQVTASAGFDYISMALAVFVLPFLLFSGYSGHLSDKVSKRTVMIAVKVFEIGAMTMGLAVFFTDRVNWMLAVLFLMALHSTIFSPAKYGFVPELLEDKDLSRANGLLEMTTFVAIVLGTSIGSFLFWYWSGEAWRTGVAMVGVAILGLAISFGIPRTAAEPTEERFRWNPFAEVIIGTRHLLRDKPLALTVVGISYFWMLGALFQLDLFFYGSEVLHVSEVKIGLMVTALAVGIGAGSLIAGKLSGDRVDLGFVPAGSALMGLFSVALAAAKGSYGWSVAALAALGLASGLFIVPLNAFLQQRSERSERGRIIATNNFFNTIGLMLAAGALWLFHDRLHVSPDKLILASGWVTLAATVYVVMVLPDHLMRLTLRVAVHTLFRIRVEGRERVPRQGGALLVSNHVSFVDGVLIAAAINRNVRFMIWKPYFNYPAFNWFLRQIRAIPVGTNGPRDMVAAIVQAREELKHGHVVCIFAEGSITRTGGLQPFKRGLEKIAHGAGVPVIPTHLDRLWGSMFSFAGGKFFAKGHLRIAHPVTVSFGEPAATGASAQEVRQAVMELGAEAACLHKERGDTLGERFIRSARRNWNRFAMADSSGRELTHGRALTGSLLVSDWARRNSTNNEMVGVLLPPSAGGALANMGLTLAGRVPVNLNFTAGKEAMAAAIEQCGIGTTITSKTFLAKAKIDATEGMVYLEDVLARVGRLEKALAGVRARIAPVRALLEGQGPDSLATVLFSSGSTSAPKGVMLSHYNVISNIEAMLQVFDLNGDDRVVGVLPFFHSFGFTVTLWLPAVLGCGAIYHVNPTDAKTIGEMIERYRGTLLLSTPTFAAAYAHKCAREQFASLRFVLVGAEKLRESAAKAFEDAFGLKMLEGYGCTEMAPVVSANTAGYEAGRDSQSGAKAGSVGRPLPGVAVRVVDPETGVLLPVGREGLLLVKGPNRMLGYLGQPERTMEALRDGWYDTGDIGVLDEDGFLKITDRLARFSKIGGEMVPHLKIEEAVLQATGGEPCCVTGIPDERKGERIALLYTAAGISGAEVWHALAATDLSKLWLPKREDIHRVDVLPMLGTGKVDFRGVRAMAIERAEAASQKAPA